MQYVGRPIDTDDLMHGVRLNSLLLVNAASVSESLLNMIGGGWSYIGVPSIPTSLGITLAFTLEFGEVEPTTLLRLSVQIASPLGAIVFERPLDVEVPDCLELAKRASGVLPLHIMVTEHGLWTVIVKSSTHELGRYLFECRKM